MVKYYKPRIKLKVWFNSLGSVHTPPSVIVINPGIFTNNRHITSKCSIHSKAVNHYFKQRIKSFNKRGK